MPTPKASTSNWTLLVYPLVVFAVALVSTPTSLAREMFASFGPQGAEWVARLVPVALMLLFCVAFALTPKSKGVKLHIGVRLVLGALLGATFAFYLDAFGRVPGLFSGAQLSADQGIGAAVGLIIFLFGGLSLFAVSGLSPDVPKPERSQRRMTVPASLALLCDGAALVLVVAASTWTWDTLDAHHWALLVAVPVLLVISALLQVHAWRVADELYRRVWTECLALTGLIFILVGMFVSMLQAIGSIGAIPLWKTIALVYALYIVISFVLVGVRMPGAYALSEEEEAVSP
jgi:hypothetical protein